MQDQKLENLLNLALSASPEDFQKSQALQTGYDEETGTWELIVRHTGDLSIVEQYGAKWETLLNGYGIVTAPERSIDAISDLPQIEYVEKPKRLFFSLDKGKQASCLSGLQAGEGFGGEDTGSRYNLTGRGVLVAVIDSGE